MVVQIKPALENYLSTNRQEGNESHNGISTASSAPTEKEWPQIIAIITACLASVGNGLLFSWNSPSIPILTSPESSETITQSQDKYLTVLPSITLALGAPLYAILPDKIGRKYCLLVFNAGPQLISWLLIAFTPSIECLYLSRLLSGAADSCLLSVMPMYMREVASPKVRGTWGNGLIVSFIVGELMVNAVGSYLSIKDTAMILVSVPILFICTFSFMPESPYYLIMKGQDEKSKEALTWLRYGKTRSDRFSEVVDEEFKQLSVDIARQLSEKGRLMDLFTISSNRKGLIISCTLVILQQYSGYSVFSIYTKSIFDSAGGSVNSTESTLIYLGIYLFCTFAFSYVLDRIGRRKALISSSLLTGICLTLLSVFVYLKSHSTLDLSAISWFPIAGMVAYIISTSAGLTSVPSMLWEELFSSSVKGKALCIMNILSAVAIGTSTELVQELTIQYGMYVPFAIFATCCFAIAVISYYIIPNTTGKTLEQIQQHMKNDNKRVSS